MTITSRRRSASRSPQCWRQESKRRWALAATVDNELLDDEGIIRSVVRDRLDDVNLQIVAGSVAHQIRGLRDVFCEREGRLNRECLVGLHGEIQMVRIARRQAPALQVVVVLVNAGRECGSTDARRQ